MGDCISKKIIEINTIIIGCVDNQNDEDHITADDLKETISDRMKNEFIIGHEASIKSIKAYNQIEHATPLAIGQNAKLAATNNFQLQSLDSNANAPQLVIDYTKNINAFLAELKEIKYDYVYGSSESEIKAEIEKKINGYNLSEELTSFYLSQPYDDHDDLSFQADRIAKKKFGFDIHSVRAHLDEQEYFYQIQIAGSVDSGTDHALEIGNVAPENPV